MKKFIAELCKREGRYIGKGINHEKENFTGTFTLTPIINGCAVEIEFTAAGDSGEVYHTEKTTLALSQDNQVNLWSINSNVPYMFQHELKSNQLFEGNNSRFIFGLNDPCQRDVFRE